MINYEKSRIKPRVTPESNEVDSWVFGLTGTCSDSGEYAYIDAVWDVSKDELKRYMFWTKEQIDIEFAKCASVNKFNEKIDNKINNKKSRKVEISDFDYNSI